jgi:hypothetical protein
MKEKNTKNYNLKETTVTKRIILELLFEWSKQVAKLKKDSGSIFFHTSGTAAEICTNLDTTKAIMNKINNEIDKIIDYFNIKFEQKIKLSPSDLTKKQNVKAEIKLEYSLDKVVNYFDDNYSKQAYINKLEQINNSKEEIIKIINIINKAIELASAQKDNKATINSNNFEKENCSSELVSKILDVLIDGDKYLILPKYNHWGYNRNKYYSVSLPTQAFYKNNYTNFTKALADHQKKTTDKKKVKLVPVITFKNNKLFEATSNIKIEDIKEKDFIYSVCDYIFNYKKMGDKIYWDEIAEHATGVEQGSDDKNNKRTVYDSVILINKKAKKKIKQKIIKNIGMDKYERLA